MKFDFSNKIIGKFWSHGDEWGIQIHKIKPFEWYGSLELGEKTHVAIIWSSDTSSESQKSIQLLWTDCTHSSLQMMLQI